MTNCGTVGDSSPTLRRNLSTSLRWCPHCQCDTTHNKFQIGIGGVFWGNNTCLIISHILPPADKSQSIFITDNYAGYQTIREFELAALVTQVIFMAPQIRPLIAAHNGCNNTIITGWNISEYTSRYAASGYLFYVWLFILHAHHLKATIVYYPREQNTRVE